MGFVLVPWAKSHGTEESLSLGLHSNGVSYLTPQGWSACLGLPPSSTVPGISLLYPGPLLVSIMPGSLCLLSHCMWSSCHTCRSFLMLICPPRYLSCHSLLRICSLGPVGLQITSPITSTPVYDPIYCVLFLGHCLLAYLISFQKEKQLVTGRSRRKIINWVLPGDEYTWPKATVVRTGGRLAQKRLWMPGWRISVELLTEL